jgi:hypothetical protein
MFSQRFPVSHWLQASQRGSTHGKQPKKNKAEGFPSQIPSEAQQITSRRDSCPMAGSVVAGTRRASEKPKRYSLLKATNLVLKIAGSKVHL